jgi:hypothetical protein
MPPTTGRTDWTARLDADKLMMIEQPPTTMIWHASPGHAGGHLPDERSRVRRPPGTRSSCAPAESSTSNPDAWAGSVHRSRCMRWLSHEAQLRHGGMLESGIGRAHNLHPLRCLASRPATSRRAAAIPSSIRSIRQRSPPGGWIDVRRHRHHVDPDSKRRAAQACGIFVRDGAIVNSSCSSASRRL